MPKRTNDFQKLIRMLTQLLGDNVVVEESKMLTDLVSGEPRQVDIYAEGTFAGHTVNIASSAATTSADRVCDGSSRCTPSMSVYRPTC
jgi:hypothetical protein